MCSLESSPARGSEPPPGFSYMAGYNTSNGNSYQVNNLPFAQMSDRKQQELTCLSNANNYFAQKQRELNLREAEIIRKENALNNRLLKTDQLSPSNFIATNIWPAAEPTPILKPRGLDFVENCSQRVPIDVGTHDSRPGDFARETFRPCVPPPPGFHTLEDNRGFELYGNDHYRVANASPTPSLWDMRQEYHYPSANCVPAPNMFDAPQQAPMETRDMHERPCYSETNQVHEDNNEVKSLIDAMRTMTSQINRRQTAPLQKEDKFSGDPLSYRRFIKHFDCYLAKGVTDMGEKLDLLISSCAGEARANIADCIMARTPDLGYFEARKILERLYGQDHSIVNAYVSKIVNGPSIKANDRSALSGLSRDMRNCLMACGDLSSAGLDTQQTVASIFTRLPRHLQDKFMASVAPHLETGRPITFAMLADFVERRALIDSSFLGQVVEQRNDRIHDKGSRTFPHFRKSSVNAVHGEPNKSPKSSGVGESRCAFCAQDHALWKCPEFGKASIDNRWSFAKEKRLCFNCLGSHFSKSCRSKGKCNTCRGNHHTLLHRAPRGGAPRSEDAGKNGGDNGAGGTKQVISAVALKSERDPMNPNAVDLDSSAKTASGNVNNAQRSQVRLRVIPVKVWGSKKGMVKTYAFLDEGSDTTLCTERLLDKLKQKGQPVKMSIATVNGIEDQAGRKVSLSVQGVKESAVISLPNVISVSTLPNFRSSIPTSGDCKVFADVLQGVTFPDYEGEVELLIGADVPEAHRALEYRLSQTGGPCSVKCALGWSLVGPVGQSPGHLNSMEVRINFLRIDNAVLHDMMQKMYERDFVNKDSDLEFGASVEDKRALQIMEESVVKENGHYQIALPWKSKNTKLPNNKVVAEKRIDYLGNKLKKDPLLHGKYRDKMAEYLESGHACKIPKHALAPSPKTWYVPHHATSGKFRVVFDCAAKFKGTSLNEHLLQGPDQTSNLMGVLLRFRSGPVAVMADIKGMFHQVMVAPEDRDSLRFLWWPNGDLDLQPEEYQMKVHLFGATSSPSVCGFALRRVAVENKPLASNRVIEAIQTNFYVDDLLISFDSCKEAVPVITDLKSLLHSSGFSLTKFVSNDAVVLHSIPEKDRRGGQMEVDIDSPKTEKALGVSWVPGQDQFRFRLKLTEKSVTRRGILSTISQCFDPLGMIQPALLPAKRLLQELCASGLGWDDPVASDKREFWNSYLVSLQALSNISVPRCYQPCNFQSCEVQLHCFCDASQTGYGAVLYLRFRGSSGQYHCSFVMGRSRVAPLKPMTIPRMELVAAVTGVELVGFVQRELNFHLDRVVFWTDSTSVLCYIRSTARRYRTFVANRIAIIQSASSPQQWRHVGTAENPADIGSRGLMPDQLSRSEIWLNGPAFLWLEENKWPANPIDLRAPNLDSTDVELRSCHLTSVADHGTLPTKEYPLNLLLNHFSNFTKLKRAVAWFVRLTKIAKAKSTKNLENLEVGPVLCAAELENAELDIIRLVQLSCFPLELALLKDTSLSDQSTFGTNLKISRLRKLSPVLSQGLIRVGGRLQRSSLPEFSKHPIILPSAHHVTTLIIRHVHAAVGHMGPLHTLAKVREKYWIVKGHATVRKVINACRGCRVRNAPQGEQLMAPLPAPRVTAGKPPFSSCGVDYAGPLLTRVGRRETKRYICLFTCLATRAVHLECAFSLDVDSFLLAFTRFINRRGSPEELWSDNGLNFVGANRELRKSIREWNQSAFQSNMALRGIKWRFNPPAACHQGGVWERLVRSVKRVLNAIAGPSKMTDETLLTFLTEVERILNGRPLTPVSSDPRDFEALTPNHLLAGVTDPSYPLGRFLNADGYRKSWRLAGLLADHFWWRWLKEYMPILQQRQKWLTPKRNFRVGDIVLVGDESTKRGQWPKGLIEETYAGKDGLVRSVRLRTAKSPSLVRDVRKLYLLEASD